MDLYIQIGVLLIFTSALSLFMFMYNAPIDTFVRDIESNNRKLTNTLDEIRHKDLEVFDNNPSVSGILVESLIKSSVDKNLAIIIQTKNQQGLLVNYGYQLRHMEDNDIYPKRYGSANADPNGEGTPFEKSYVSSMQTTFGESHKGMTPYKVPYTSSAFAVPGDTPSDSSHMWYALGLNSAQLNAYPRGSKLSIGNIPDGPKVFLFKDGKTVAESYLSGDTYYNRGHFYTDNVLKQSLEPNNNYSNLDAPSSLYYLDRNASYYSVLIVNSNGVVVGAYIEQHGTKSNGNLLGRAMLESGLISSMY